MSSSTDDSTRKASDSPAPTPPPDPKKKSADSPAPPPAGDVENQAPGTGLVVAGVLRRWRQEDLLKRVSLVLRALGLLFSFLAFIIMASNKHGDWENFDDFEAYRYVLAIGIISMLYTAAQTLRQVHELSTGKHLFSQRNLALLDFIGDQIAAYLLISAASAAIPVTSFFRELEAENVFTDSSAAAISMEFLAFLALAVSALISGYKLSNQSYI